MTLTRPWLLPNLLSLDAPIVAVLWQQLFVRTLNVPATTASGITLAATVWLIYAGDRMLDAWTATEQSARHRFYQRHWRSVVPVLIAAIFLAGWSALTGIRTPVLRSGLALLFVVAIYFCAVHGAPQFTQRWWPKELVVAIIFAAGTCIHVWTFGTQPAGIWTWPFLIFMGLCWINTAAIAYWEHGASHASTVWLGSHLRELSAAIAMVAFLLAWWNPFPQDRLLYLAEGVSAIGYFALDRFSACLSSDALRVAADAVLCSPALLLPFV